jgi:type VI secretion system secreted protein VgrG
VLLGTAAPFVVLAGSAATNTGPSVLNGDLGVSPGSALTGFSLPAVVNGATHDNDAVAAQAQSALTTAYNTAAGQPSAVDLTGQDLGGLTLSPGAYSYSTSAQLTGTVTLDAAGDPNAQFVFEIGSTLTTASASTVSLINGASPCNVYWQVGSSATLGTTTAFQGNLMALTSITINNRASVVGRALARTGAVTLDDNLITGAACGTSVTPPSVAPGGGDASAGGGSPDITGAPGASPAALPTTQPPPASRSTVPTHLGTAILRRTPRQPSAPGAPGTPSSSCTDGFIATVTGHQIKRVVFSLDGKAIATRTAAPFRVAVGALTGRHRVTARVTVKDATRARTLRLGYVACAAAVRHPRSGPSQFTG